MPRNSSGTYSLPSGNPVVSNTLIQTTWANPTMSDLGTGITDSLDRSGRGAMLAPLKNTDGTAVAPSMTFSSEGTLGLYRVSAGVLGFAAGGALVLSIAAGGLVFVSPLVLPLGTALLPSLTFTANTNTGLFSPGVNQVALTTNGVQRLTVDAAGNVVVATGGVTLTAGTLTLATGALVMQAVGANFITAQNAAGTLAFQTGGANTRMTVDALGNVGVNVTPSNLYAPGRVLQITAGGATVFGSTTTALYAQNINVDAAGNLLYQTTGTAMLYRQSSAVHAWQTAASGTAGATTTLVTLMTLDASGNVGIGAVPPAWSAAAGLRAVQVGALSFFTGDSNTMRLTNNAWMDGSSVWRTIITGPASLFVENSGAHYWFNAASAVAGAALTLVQAMSLDNSGSLGIGVVPSAWALGGYRALEVGAVGSGIFGGLGDMNVSSNAYYAAGWKYASANPAGYYAANNGTHAWFTAPAGATGGAIAFAQRLVIDNPGNIGIGVTPSAWSAGHALEAGFAGNAIWGSAANGLNLVSNAFFNAGYKYAAAGTATLYAAGTGTHTFYAAVSGAAGAAVPFVASLQIDAAGNVGIGATPSAWGAAFKALQVSGGGFAGQGTGPSVAQNIFFNGSNWIYSANGFGGLYQIANSFGHIWYVAPTGLAAGTAALLQAMSITATGIIQDGASLELGWKDIPLNTQAGPYTLVIGDRAKCVTIGATGATVPPSVFSAGAVISIWNNSAGSITITQGAAVTLYYGPTGTTGNRTLTTRGICTVLCLAANTFVITGAGLT